MSLSKRVLYDLTFTGGNAGNLNARSGTISNILSNVISTGNLNVSGNVNVSGTLTTVNITSTNIVDTNISAGNITVTNISSTTGTIGTVLSTNANITTGTVGTLSSTTGTIGTLSSTTGTIGTLLSTTGTIGTLLSTTGTIGTLLSTTGTIGTLSSTTGTIGTLSSTAGTIGTLIASSATVTNANITTQTTGTSIVTGNVGIGTGSPSAKLNVVGDTVIQSGLLTVKNNGGYGVIELSGTTGSYIDFGPDTIDFRSRIIHNEGDRSFSFFVNGGTNTMTLASTGNVGIGTGSPMAKLEVYDAANSIIRASGAVSGQQGFNITDTASRWSIYKPGNTTDLRFYDGTGDRVTFANGGNVGIGTVSPGYNLDVNGSLATNTMLIRNATYSTTLASQVYNANTWYTAISPNVLALGIYIISLVFSAGGTPWNIYTSFINYVGHTSDNQSLYLSGANVPTTIHANNSNGIDYQVKVRGLYGPYNQSSGIQFSIAGTTSSGSWEVKAYRLI
jgi:hypothetical protein